MMNRVVLVGRLTRDPEIKKTQTGKSVLSFTVAVTRKFNKDQTDFINCQAWKKTAEFIANYLGKGSLVSVEGTIQSRSFEDNAGKKVFVQEVLTERVQGLEPKRARETTQPAQRYETSAYEAEEYEPVLDITSDDLPF